MSHQYSNYFSVDQHYFPQINPSTIVQDPESWRRTYPHETFMEMLRQMERMLSREEHRSLWLEGAYGTGKSQCAYALKKILEVPEEELRRYWENFDGLRSKQDLLAKLLGHKESGIVAIHRYASGDINSPRQLCFEIQESIRHELDRRGLKTGMETLKESVIAWLEKDVNKVHITNHLRGRYGSYFSQGSADEIIDALRSGREIHKLMDNIFLLGEEEGLTVLSFNMNRLIQWLRHVIEENDNLNIVFIWDEFSDYFRNNLSTLSEFQKLVELVNEKPFYFIPVTHESGQMFSSGDSTVKKLLDRFTFSSIKLPDNIAFELIGYALKPNESPEIRKEWDECADDLNRRVNDSRHRVMEAAGIRDEAVMKKIMPLHPMAALVLKYIATSFQSNQRSMFDFIKSSDPEVKAFQWFIENRGPMDDHPLLTVDMLWSFFYERGRNNLTSNIRRILDVFPQQKQLTKEEQQVLKAVLILQAIDEQLAGALDIFKATDRHLDYVFEGIASGLDTGCRGIASKLRKDGILVSRPMSNGQTYYAAAVLAGDQSRIDQIKEELKATSTEKLVTSGEMGDMLDLTPALKLRFEVLPGKGNLVAVTKSTLNRTLNGLQNQESPGKFSSIIAFAKDEAEAVHFRNELKEKAKDPEYQDILFIDALTTPLGHDAFENWVEESAMANYHQSSNRTAASDHSSRADSILKTDWKNRAKSNALILYSSYSPEGERHANAESIKNALQAHVMRFYQNKAGFACSFEFNRGLTEVQFKETNLPLSARCGIEQESKSIVNGLEKHTLAEVWKVEKYWEKEETKNLPISRIKQSLEALIQRAFEKDGQIAIGDIYDYLQENYGFVPSNLHAFLTGFLLSEYGHESYRFADPQGGSGPMTADYLSTMIANCLKGKNARSSFIVKMTPVEMSFFELCEKAWGISPNSCASAGEAGRKIKEKMRSLKLPLWTLCEVVEGDLHAPISKFMELVQKEGKEAHQKAMELGALARELPDLGDRLAAVLTVERCQEGMRKFLDTFEEGRLPALAAEIGAESAMLGDVRHLFDSVEHSSLWTKELGLDEIRKVLVDYSVVRESNCLLSVSKSSREEVLQAWRERLSFFRISHEVISDNNPTLNSFVALLLKIYKGEGLLPKEMEIIQDFLIKKHDVLKALLNNEKNLFGDVYRVYLEELSEEDIEKLLPMIPKSMFALSRTESNQEVKNKAEEYRKGQKKTQLFDLWAKKTGTRTPNEWSRMYKTPILCCVGEEEFKKAKKCFDTLNSALTIESDINDALTYLEEGAVFEVLADEKKRNTAFVKHIIGKYKKLLTDADKVRARLEQMDPEVYQWYGDPAVRNKVREMAEAEYQAGGSNQALEKIDSMEAQKLKEYLKRLVQDNITIGLEIIDSEGE